MDIRTLCLGILTMQDATGYEIKKFFQDELSHFYDASFGSIYPALTKLAADGFLSVETLPQEGRPDKKIYSITPKGRLEFIDALKIAPKQDKFRSEFLALVIFSELMEPAHLSRLIDNRINTLADLIRDLEKPNSFADDTVGVFMRDYGLAVRKAERKYLQENRHLLEAKALLAAAAG